MLAKIWAPEEYLLRSLNATIIDGNSQIYLPLVKEMDVTNSCPSIPEAKLKAPESLLSNVRRLFNRDEPLSSKEFDELADHIKHVVFGSSAVAVQPAARLGSFHFKNFNPGKCVALLRWQEEDLMPPQSRMPPSARNELWKLYCLVLFD